MKINTYKLNHSKAMIESLYLALHCHHVAVSGQVDYNTKTDDRKWYTESRKNHMDKVRYHKAAIEGKEYNPRHRTVYGYIQNGKHFITTDYNEAKKLSGYKEVVEFREYSSECFAFEGGKTLQGVQWKRHNAVRAW